VLVVSTNPFLELIATLVGRHLNAVVSASNANTLLNQSIEELQAITLDGLVLHLAVHVEEDAVGIVKGGGIIGPTIEVKG